VFSIRLAASTVAGPIISGYGFTFTAPAAPSVALPATGNITGTTTRIVWHPFNGSNTTSNGFVDTPINTYQIAYRVTGSGTTGWQYVTAAPNLAVTDLPLGQEVLWFDLTGLQSGTPYEYRIRTLSCATSLHPGSTSNTNTDGVNSPWTDVNTFTTAGSTDCGPVATVLADANEVADADGTFGATITWTTVENATCYIVEWAYDGSPAVWRSSVPAGSDVLQSYSVSGLWEGTTYDARVYTLCSGECPELDNVMVLPGNGLPAGVQGPTSTEFTTPLPRAGAVENGLSGFSVYPNPNKGSFFVSFSATQAGTADLRLTDAIGRTVLATNAEVAVGANQLPIEVRNYAKGVYLLQVTLGDVRVNAKVVLE